MILCIDRLGLGNLELTFDRYEASNPLMKISGEARLDVLHNSMLVQVLLLYDEQDNCTASLRSVSVEELSGVNASLTGMWKFNSLYSKVVTWFIKKSTDSIREKLNKTMKKSLSKALNKYDFCNQLLPG